MDTDRSSPSPLFLHYLEKARQALQNRTAVATTLGVTARMPKQDAGPPAPAGGLKAPTILEFKKRVGPEDDGNGPRPRQRTLDRRFQGLAQFMLVVGVLKAMQNRHGMDMAEVMGLEGERLVGVSPPLLSRLPASSTG
ncbi:MAG: hypothetical protein HQL82_08655 [Magnetococcales bacterium]|nr:hypothetical protein [Magnetococcales bacterium]